MNNKINQCLRRMSQIRRNFGATCTLKGTRATKSLVGDHYTQAQGRSMVEMLGVLAIIGVLSVGAIAGYSKAMFKYKLNKHAESFSTLLNEAIKLYPDLRRHYGNNSLLSTNLNSLLNKMNLIPDGMTLNDQNNLIYDVFKNNYYLNYSVGQRNNGQMYIDYYISSTLHRSENKLTEHDREVCRNIMITAKENAADINQIEVRSSGDADYTQKALYGGKSSQTTNLLRNASLAKIDEVCDSCNSEVACYLILYINIEN